MAESAKKAEKKAPKTKRSLRRRALIGLGVIGVAVPALWVAIHEVPGFGPAVADGVRAVLGPGVVAWAEDTAYAIQDRIDRLRYAGNKPKTFWEAPPASAEPAAPTPPPDPSAAPSGEPGAQPPPDPVEVAFPPAAFKPPVPAVASDGDGTWIAIKDEGAPGQPPMMVKALVHPDGRRNFAAVAVVALDLRRVDLHLVAGTQEPANDKVPSAQRPGIVPKEAFPDLVAAFNGGFKVIHGHWGMMLDGVTFAPPREIGCTVALYKDGAFAIRGWPAVKGDVEKLAFWRQTPPCLVEQGKTNNLLEATEYSKNWGATVSGETVIRRSAIGVDKTGRVLFYALGEAVTAQALARAMRAVGADGAAQLDVNYSYPRFLFYGKTEAGALPKVSDAIIPGIKYQKTEYVGGSEVRDFFYVTRKRPAS